MTDKWGSRLFKAGTAALLGLMSSYKFNLMGSARSMSDLLRGFSVSFMLGALGFALFDLLLFRERAGLLKRAALANIIWLAAMTGVSLYYFFIVPTSFLAVTLLIFVLAWLNMPAEGTT